MHARRLFVLSALLFGGCFETHLTGDDAVPPSSDGGVWTDCWAAFSSGREGERCAFDASCGETPCGDDGGLELLCLGGRLRFVERICSIPVPECEHYLANGGSPGQACEPTTFGDCSRPVGRCCHREITCDATTDRVIDEVQCTHECEERSLCEDYALPPPERPTCTSSSECGGLSCVPADTPPACGLCPPVVRECEGHDECGPSHVCVEEEYCDCDSGPSSFCRPVCSEDDCAEGERCRDVCEPIPCGAGFECPPNTYCTTPHDEPPGPVDAHGCTRLTCATDAECACGVCIDGLCQSGPGICQAS